MDFQFVKQSYPQPHTPQIGDVYVAKASGPKGRKGTRYWMIVSITQSLHCTKSVHMIGLTAEGDVVSTTSYGIHAIENRTRVGTCPDIAAMKLRIIKFEV